MKRNFIYLPLLVTTIVIIYDDFLENEKIIWDCYLPVA